jgi:hypothetical protein
MQKDTRTTAHGRIQKDLREVNDKLNPDSPPIFALPVGDSLDHVDALIMGPPETPYSFGFFRFGAALHLPSCFFSKLTCHRRADMQFPSTYPNTPPKVLMYELHLLLRSHLCAHSSLCGFPQSSTTTNGGRTRFNPNLYAGGKGIHPCQRSTVHRSYGLTTFIAQCALASWAPGQASLRTSGGPRTPSTTY